MNSKKAKELRRKEKQLQSRNWRDWIKELKSMKLRYRFQITELILIGNGGKFKKYFIRFIELLIFLFAAGGINYTYQIIEKYIK